MAVVDRMTHDQFIAYVQGAPDPTRTWVPFKDVADHAMNTDAWYRPEGPVVGQRRSPLDIAQRIALWMAKDILSQEQEWPVRQAPSNGYARFALTDEA